jgi:putative DNA primase/helicase
MSTPPKPRVEAERLVPYRRRPRDVENAHALAMRAELAETITLSPGAPLVSARTFMAKRFTHAGLRTLLHHNGAFHAWTGTHYPEADDAGLRAGLYDFLDGAVRPFDDGKVGPFNPTRSKVADVLDALAAVANLRAGIRSPAWLGEAVDLPADEIVACRNGLLHLPSGTLLPHTPKLFTQHALDFDYDPMAPAPAAWLHFLAMIWDADEGGERRAAAEVIDALQEIFGYCLTADTRQQKAFLIIGPKRSGKGTIARTLTRLVGSENVAGPTLASLGQNFGLAPLIGKRVAIISDARLGGRADQQAIAERLLAISGEDALTIDRKYRPAWTGRLPTRFLVLSNELPRLADASGALASRFIVLVMTRSFYGQEDHGLETTLAAELPGILNWAIAGWRRLQDRGHFVQPSASAEAVQEFEDLGSPIGAFLRERCVLRTGASVLVDQLFAMWGDWCKENGWENHGTKASFGKNLRAALPSLTTSQPRDHDGRQRRCYEGIGLRRHGDTR